MVVGRLKRILERPVEGASVAIFRLFLGGLLLTSTVRFVARGWVRAYFGEPRHFFHYWGFEWVRPLPVTGMYWLYGGLAACALAVLCGVWQRMACALFALGFGYAHFCDKTNYLNHYYLLTLLTGTCAFLPLDRDYSLRAFWWPTERAGQVRAWVLYLLRFQIGVVYVFGGLGKIGSDWLFHGEPLRLWLAANAELPLLGALLVQPGAGVVFSWCGALFDLSVVPLLSIRRTRGVAYALVVGFHVLTALLFHIGMFPWLMIGSATLFFEPSWPRRLLGRVGRVSRAEPVAKVAGAALSPVVVAALGLSVAVQLSLPLRAWLYPGNTLWTEEGFRFSWKVMLIEKSGELELLVVDRAGRRYQVEPREYATPIQVRMASTQPDMILELAHWVAADFSRRGHGPVAVYADSQVSFNGRPHQRFIDPKVDLAREVDSLRSKTWVLPAPSAAPP